MFQTLYQSATNAEIFNAKPQAVSVPPAVAGGDFKPQSRRDAKGKQIVLALLPRILV
jgi:hypothetical protein